MGRSYSFTCSKCGYNQQLYEGHTFMVHNQSVEDFFASSSVKLHYKTLQKIKQLSKKKKGMHLRIEYKVYRCRVCRNVSDRLFVQLTDEGKVLHETKFKCSHCHVRLKHTNIHRLKYAVCPKCKNSEFKKEKELVLWS